MATGDFGGTILVWDLETGVVVRRLEAHADGVSALAFSLDGTRLLSGGWGGMVVHWDVSSGEPLAVLEAHDSHVTAVRFLPDGRGAVSSGGDHVVRSWDLETGTELLAIEEPHWVSDVAVSVGGRRAATASWDGSARVHDLETGKLVRRITTPVSKELERVAFARDGSTVVTLGRHGALDLWDVASGERTGSVTVDSAATGSLDTSPDGRLLLVTSGRTVRLYQLDPLRELERWEGRAALFLPDGRLAVHFRTGAGEGGAFFDGVAVRDLEDGRERAVLRGTAAAVLGAALSPDGRHLGVATADSTVRVLSLPAGAQLHRVNRPGDPLLPVRFAPDGGSLVTGSGSGAIRFWDVRRGEPLREFQGAAPFAPLAWSPDGRRLATVGGDHVVQLRDPGSGEVLGELRGHRARVTSITFSPDGGRILTTGEDAVAALWDAISGRGIVGGGIPHVDPETGAGFVEDGAFLPDGHRVLTVGADPTPLLWDPSHPGCLESPPACPELRRFDGHARYEGRSRPVLSAAVSPDGRTAATGGADRAVLVWDLESGERLHRLSGHQGGVASLSFGPDGRTLISAGGNSVRVWDVAEGRLLGSLVFFLGGSWAVVDPSGRYDASNGGDVEGLHWVVGLEPVALHQLKERYYEPGLLAKLMGFNDEPLRDVRAFRDVDLYPEVEITGEPTAADPAIRFTLRNRGGGIGRLVVSLNGKELAADARPAGADPRADSLTINVDVGGSPYLLPGGPNRVEVRAFNAEGYLSSRARGLEVAAPTATPGDGAEPHLWAVVAGVSDYAGTAIDLRYAAKDAEDVAGALRLAGGRLFGGGRTHVTLLRGDGGAAPSRARLVRALEALADSATSSDVVVVYLSGHGVVHGGAEGDYYYLTAEARSAELGDPAVREAVAVSSEELTELLKAIPALKQVLILDTCGAGRAVETLTAARDVSSSQVRAIQRMKDRAGMFVLAGSAADAVSYEASRYAQGVLTYSLLMGLKGAALREGEFVDVSTLFNHAVDEVPRLAGEIGGIQRPELATPRGGQSFDIGRLTTEDRERIPLAEARPLVLRAVFQDERPPFTDGLGLGKAINDALRDASAEARGEGTLVFVDSAELPGAHVVTGRYAVDGERVVVSGFVVRGEETVGAFEMEGAADEVEDLAARIVAKARKVIR